MSMDSKKSMAWTVVLILLGMAALYGGSKWLSLLIPAAVLVWYAAKPRLKNWPELTERLKIEKCRSWVHVSSKRALRRAAGR